MHYYDYFGDDINISGPYLSDYQINLTSLGRSTIYLTLNCIFEISKLKWKLNKLVYKSGDFEQFDFRDRVNVAAYLVMSVGKKMKMIL